ncbi:transcription antitermination factor NusB [Aciduricibacillus chroicocephali]|uniref:Transcription antitermination protein NusB n=1 Tax=Aciduricibacillus chroicocephali TaxID=3054939 RepID=A0ABY9KUU2_9BACI|nr:transcription antitermination factor NusB [Bacillaceae bacterium 44XB]
MNRHQAREKAFQMLFQLELNKRELPDALKDNEGNALQDPFLMKLIEGVTAHKEEIDSLIASHLENWSFDRLAIAEKTILRIAVYEMRHMEDIPTNVSINEAVELANKYGDQKSGKFVNGVLSKF